MMELLRRLLSTAPDFETFRDVKPTLLVSWWCTIYAMVVVFLRIAGRYVRTEKLLIDDGIMLLAMIPLLMRMAFVHVVLLFGTNNTVTTGLSLNEIHQREVGSQLVLVSRIMYAAYLWTIKYSVSMFLRTLTESVWQRSHQRLLRFLHIFLAVTFVATIVSDLGACQPFTHYWQVVPDPGPQCRQGYANLITTGTLNITTNLAIVVFPIPMILKSTLPRKQKISIIIRLALPFLSIILTFYQLPMVINHRGAQPIRSLIASFDILLAAFTSNAVVLSSLLQDRGYKKTKYKHGTERDGFHVKRPNTGAAELKKVLSNKWGSDEDLMRSSDMDGDVVELGDNGKVLIAMDILKGDGKKNGRQHERPEVPPKAKLQDIRVATTWEIRVDKE